MSLTEAGIWTWLTRSNQFNSQKFTQDMEKITDFYQNNGYFDFRILDTDIQTNEDKTKQTIKITVHEGERFRWGKVSIEGDTNEVPKAELEKLLTMKPGKWYERQQMTEVLSAIQNRMGSAGYAYSEISVQPLPNAETKTVDFILHIEPAGKSTSTKSILRATTKPATKSCVANCAKWNPRLTTLPSCNAPKSASSF